MSIRFEWVTAECAYPQIVPQHHTPAGEYVEPDPGNVFADDGVVTKDFGMVLGDGDGMVIEGTAAELEDLFLRCARMAAKHKEA